MNFGTLSTFDRGTKDDILYDLWTTVHQVLLIIWIWFNAPVSVATTSCSRFATFSIYSRKLHVWNILWEELLSGITNWQNYNQMQAYECIRMTCVISTQRYPGWRLKDTKQSPWLVAACPTPGRPGMSCDATSEKTLSAFSNVHTDPMLTKT